MSHIGQNTKRGRAAAKQCERPPEKAQDCQRREQYTHNILTGGHDTADYFLKKRRGICSTCIEHGECEQETD